MVRRRTTARAGGDSRGGDALRGRQDLRRDHPDRSRLGDEDRHPRADRSQGARQTREVERHTPGGARQGNAIILCGLAYRPAQTSNTNNGHKSFPTMQLANKATNSTMRFGIKGLWLWDEIL
jgi:hypothetical protein